MALKLRILGSSSKGNSALLISENAKVLVDAGFSAKKLGQLLQNAGESLDSIDAVFLTHEHQDHALGLRGLWKRPDLPIFANRDTAEEVQRSLKTKLNWKYFTTGSVFSYKDLEVANFSVPHDAIDPVGFTFSSGENTLFSPVKTLAWCTDLGHVPQSIHERIRYGYARIIATCLVFETTNQRAARAFE